jgi:hypothetical protein
VKHNFFVYRRYDLAVELKSSGKPFGFPQPLNFLLLSIGWLFLSNPTSILFGPMCIACVKGQLLQTK